MARKKVKLAYITCNSKRRETFRKRKSGIIKKVNEISTLCGIEACAIIYDRNNPQPEVWPSDVGVKNVLFKFRSLPELERSKKMVDQEAFLRQSIAKIYEQLKKQREETRKKEMTNIIHHYIQSGEFNAMNLMSKHDLNDLSSFIDENLKEIEQTMKGVPTEVREEVRNGAEVMNGREVVHENINHVHGQVNGGNEQLANMGQFVQGNENNIGDEMPLNFPQWPMDFSMFQFPFINDGPNGF
ncbi:agamous-like MADS-box protein AGL80 [Lathyrus oleraceus]|uniref:MADS-box domain-containing protein n=1 Tax=Pisum sativum TaxID=3888 RepID=A0A9D4WTX5_PEA|nr:agamous-like MADS-box protein AGL80 [Pisum sativum]KAI5408371.1 hypothetical protein KIW84_054268 [Pisum sativum]